MGKKALFIQEWRRCVISRTEGAPCKMTRLVLLVLAEHMDASGGSCFPSTRLLAEECRTSRKTVEKYLRKAVRHGWIERSARGGGQSWRRYEYQARFPSKAGSVLDPAEPENVGMPTPEAGEAHDGNAGHHVPTRKSESTSGGSTTTSIQSPRHKETAKEVVWEIWPQVRPTILHKWHGGVENIEVNGEAIGMGKEFKFLEDLLESRPTEDVIAAVGAAPALPGWKTPTSLRWLTSRKHGSANFERAMGMHYKRSSADDPGPAQGSHAGPERVQVELPFLDEEVGP